MLRFSKTGDAFCYVFEQELSPAETIIIKMPAVSPNKRGVNDIGWMCEGDIKLHATLSSNPESDAALWQEIFTNEEINKTISAIKAANEGTTNAKIIIRAILN